MVSINWDCVEAVMEIEEVFTRLGSKKRRRKFW